jgi:glycolate oxidase FAD binding subunit
MVESPGPASRLETTPNNVGEVIAPASTNDIGTALADATASARSVLPFGGAISIVSGRPVDRFDIGLDLAGIRGIVSWEPADLVLSVRAGTTFAEVQAELGRHGQAIPVDVAYPERATIGGLIATGFAGPRRLRSGSFRDLLIGCEYVRGDGLIANAGGMVVKNVSGFEVPRFLHGSWGALAILTTVNLKVTPTPRADGTYIANPGSVEEAIARGLDLIRGVPSIDACTITVDAGKVTLAVRTLGRDRAVSETLTGVSAVAGPGETCTGSDSAGWWQQHVNRFGELDQGALLALSTRPRQVADLVGSVLRIPQVAAGASIAIDPGLGSIRVGLNANRAATLVDIAQVAAGSGAGYVIERDATGAATGIDPWGPAPDGIEIMRALKNEFDPANVLNRGRLLVS